MILLDFGMPEVKLLVFLIVAMVSAGLIVAGILGLIRRAR